MTQFSLFAPRGDFEQVAAAARCAEDAGFDGCLFGEHHGVPQIPHPQLLTLLAALAARTTRIRLGTSILLTPLHDPIQVAESAAMVDVISRGRLILGVGIGYQEQDFNHFGLSIRQRVSRFEESLEVIRRAWDHDRFSFHGKRFRYENVAVYPKPAQRPHPPIWVAAWSDAGARRAGRLGDAFVTDPIHDLKATRRLAATYRESASSAGRAPRVVLMRELLCAPTRAEALDRFGPGLVATYRYYWANGGFNPDLEPWVRSVSTADEITLERTMPDRVIVGSPDDCIGQLEHWIRETGAEHVQLTIPGELGPLDQAAQLEAIRFAGDRVVAKLR